MLETRRERRNSVAGVVVSESVTLGSSREARLLAPLPPARHLLRAKDLVDARYREPLDVSALARAARLSPAHFSREFRRAFGETPHQYLLTRRLERAAALLRNTDHTGDRDLLRGRSAQPRVVHDQLRAGLWPLANGLPEGLSTRSRPHPDPDLRAA